MTETTSDTPLRYRIAPAFSAACFLFASLPQVFAIIDDQIYAPAGWPGLLLLLTSMLSFWLATFTALVARAWSRWAALIGVVCLAVLLLPFDLLNYKPGLSLFLAPGLVGTLVLFIPNVRAHMEESAAGGTKSVVINGIRLIGGTVVVLLLMALSIWTIIEVRTTARHGQTQELCDQGNKSACSYLAEQRLGESWGNRESLKHLKTLEDLCDEQDATGCHEAAQGGRTLSRNDLFRTEDPARMLKDVVFAACGRGDERACFIRSLEWDRYQTQAEQQYLSQLCDDDNIWACRAAGHLRGIPEEETLKYRQRTCAAGFGRECLDILESHPEIAIRGLNTNCQADTSGLACESWLKAAGVRESLGDDYLGQLRRACHGGSRWSCGELAASLKSTEESDEQRTAEVYEAFSASQPGPYGDNPAWIDLEIPEELDLEEACDQENPAACYGLGLRYLQEQWGPWRPALPPTTKLRSSLGKACTLGFSQACLTFGLTLLNRPIAEKRDIAGANRWLDVACKRGHSASCLQKSLELEFEEGNFSGLEDISLAACKSRAVRSDACAELAAAWLYDLKAMPRLLSDRVAVWRVRDGCAEGSRWACSTLGDILTQEIAKNREQSARAQFSVSAFDALATACSDGYQRSCRLVLLLASNYPVKTDQSPTALQKIICPEHVDRWIPLIHVCERDWESEPSIAP